MLPLGVNAESRKKYRRYFGTRASDMESNMHVSMPDNVNAHAIKNTSPCFVVPCDAPLRNPCKHHVEPASGGSCKETNSDITRGKCLE